MRKVINNRQYAGRRFNKSVSLRSWGPVYDSATQDVTSLLLLLALYYYLSLSLFFLYLFLTSLAIVPYFTTLSLSPPFTLSPPYWFLPFLSSLSLCFHANLLFIKSKELVPPQAYSNLPVWLSVLQQNSCEATTLLDSFHDFLPFFSLKNVPSRFVSCRALYYLFDDAKRHLDGNFRTRNSRNWRQMYNRVKSSKLHYLFTIARVEMHLREP